MMTCKQLNDISSDLLDEQVSFSKRLAVLLHRSMCRHCNRYLLQLKLSSTAVQKISDQSEPSDQEIDQVLDKILKRR